MAAITTAGFAWESLARSHSNLHFGLGVLGPGSDPLRDGLGVVGPGGF